MPLVNGKSILRNKNWKVIIYGKPGIGKTSSVKFLKGKTLVLSLDNSDRVLAGQDVDIYQFDRVHPEEDIMAFVKSVETIAKNYDNLFIDNISSFEKDWFVEKGRSSKNHISNEIQDYSQWTNYFSRIMTTLYMIPNINIVTTAWEKQVEITTETGQTFNQYAPEIRDSVRDSLLGLADVVGRMITNPKTGERGVLLQGTDAVFAKNRLDDRTAAPIAELYNFGEVTPKKATAATKKSTTKTTDKGASK
ncbi:AAA family ATPase [Furfurilactobacillus milii]|uniref:AAA family ATPase n=1 Tax=Furfurilactobacillus milii TaxID=2888272 RepID=A0ABT6DCF6_9LACO|nr:AAA family ATPase [Furfurilactobacillus milii]QLE66957.1 DNA-binding protein [Furfurilactobacillus rossiae]MCF6161966.1 AAA family ATPase [Furfurilactobacillus milii]MCF6164346.1 AAA family ATPase [Furfurilactobacillus milii]MDF9914834.1 AAA family ATPase [Furfurilactobacillus milii]QLE69387.1 DNA-binding protein [Furfurilactobacillus rossiae]